MTIVDPGQREEVATYLAKCRCDVDFLDEQTLRVEVPAAALDSTAYSARIELEAYVRVWNALRPNALAVVVAERDGG